MVEVCGALKHQRLPTASPQMPRTDFPQEAAPLRDSFRMVGRIMRDAHSAVRSQYVETWRYRADLSFVPAAKQ